MSIFTLCLRLVVVCSGLVSEQAIVGFFEGLGQRISKVVNLIVEVTAILILSKVANAAGPEDGTGVSAAGLRTTALFLTAATAGRALVAVISGAATRAASIVPMLENQAVVVLKVVFLTKAHLQEVNIRVKAIGAGIKGRLI